MFAGDAVFPVSFEHPEWHNGFEHDPEGAVDVRLRLLRELAATGEWLVATHMPFPSVGRWRSPATLFVGYQLGGTTERLLRLGPTWPR